MKKAILKISVATALLAMATSAFAVTSIDSAGTTLGGGTFKPSTGVTISAAATDTTYAATSQHTSSTPTNGGKQYGAVANDATIKSATAVDNGPTAVTAADALPTGVTWN